MSTCGMFGSALFHGLEGEKQGSIEYTYMNLYLDICFQRGVFDFSYILISPIS